MGKLSIRRYDFIEWGREEETHFGIVKRLSKKGYLEVENFSQKPLEYSVDAYFPFQSNFPRHRQSTLKKLSIEEMLERLSKREVYFGSLFEQGGLAGAIAARHQDNLQYAINRLKDDQSPHIFLLQLQKVAPEPGTGVYVVLAHFDFGKPKMEGLSIVPRIKDRYVAPMVCAFFPHGFGNIKEPKDYHDKWGFSAIEIPKRALHLVENPMTLEMKLSKLSQKN